MITTEELTRLEYYRKRLFGAIAKSLEQDGHCKSYEGQLSVCFPSYHDSDGDISLQLDCYVLGPTRHYEYTGKNLGKCLDKAEEELARWMFHSGAGVY